MERINVLIYSLNRKLPITQFQISSILKLFSNLFYLFSRFNKLSCGEQILTQSSVYFTSISSSVKFNISKYMAMTPFFKNYFYPSSQTFNFSVHKREAWNNVHKCLQFFCQMVRFGVFSLFFCFLFLLFNFLCTLLLL